MAAPDGVRGSERTSLHGSAEARWSASFPVGAHAPVGVVAGLVANVVTHGVEFGVAKRKRTVALLPRELREIDFAVHEGRGGRFHFAREACDVYVGLETDPHMHVILNTTNGYGHAFERQAALPPGCRAAEARSPT